jgi:hypothetical protein
MTWHADLTDDETVAQLARELADKPEPMEIVFQPSTVFQLAGLVQLALRHPGVSPQLRGTAAHFLDGVRSYFRDSSTVLDVLKRGDNPAQDR